MYLHVAEGELQHDQQAAGVLHLVCNSSGSDVAGNGERIAQVLNFALHQGIDLVQVVIGHHFRRTGIAVGTDVALALGQRDKDCKHEKGSEKSVVLHLEIEIII